MVVVSASSSRPFFFDEKPYLLDAVGTLERWGFSARALVEYPQPAGFSFGVLHTLLEPLTGLRPRRVRLVNPILLFCTMWILWRALRERPDSSAGAAAATLMSVPFTWILSGLALTEMAGLLPAVAGFALIAGLAETSAPQSGGRLALAAMAGALVGIAFYSRPPLVVIAAAAAALAVPHARLRGSIAVFLATAALLIIPTIVLWGGLVPPKVEHYSSLSFSVPHTLLSLGYAGFAMAVLAPQWLSLNWRLSASIFAAISVLNLALPVLQITALASVIRSMIGPDYEPLYARGVGSIVAGVAVVFLIASLKNLRDRRHDAVWVAYVLAMLLLVISAGKVTHQYSSRYTGLAVPFMIFAAAPYQTYSGAHLVVLAAGAIVGLASLVSYFAGP